MASGFSDFLELELLDHVWGSADYSPPASIYVALFTVAPTDAGGGTEVTGGSYARFEFTNNQTNFPAASGGTLSNGTAADFGTASANWGTVVAMGFFDASTNGNLLAWGDLSANKTVNNGDSAEFPIGALDVSLT